MLSRHFDELYADFQQYYGIDLFELDVDVDEVTRDVRRASILAAQLPRAARVNVAETPLAEVTRTDYLLRRIELNQREWAYAHTKEAKTGAGAPEPVLFDGELEERNRVRAVEARHSRHVADALGLQGLEVAT